MQCYVNILFDGGEVLHIGISHSVLELVYASSQCQSFFVPGSQLCCYFIGQ